MKKRYISTGILCVVGVILFGMARTSETDHKVAAGKTEIEPFTMVAATDLHYLAPELYQGSALFHEVMETADGKMTEYSEVILDSFVTQMIEERPDFVVLSGDLTFNGEKISHEKLSEKLLEIENEGIAVYVIPGNHDLYNTHALQFLEDSYEHVDSVTAEEFEKIYGAFGYDEAVAKDEASLSYVAKIAENVWMLCLDTNVDGYTNQFTDETLSWAENVLEEAERKGIYVFEVTHQNLLAHNQIFTSGFQIYNANQMMELNEKHDVTVNFSGHMHIQHEIEAENMTEYVTSALCVAPCQYGVASFSSDGVNYENRELNVTDWAAYDAADTSDYADFNEYAEDYFKKVSATTTRSELISLRLEDEVEEELLSAFENVNYRYFAGTLGEMTVEEQEETIQLWEKYAGDTFSCSYIKSMFEDASVKFYSDNGK